MEELKDYMLHGHEAEFVYKNSEYSIESEIRNGINTVTFWRCSEEGICIAECIVDDIEDFEKLFNVKCFDGKSFYEIEAEVTVEAVF